MDEHEDDRLVRAHLQGDRRAFEQLYQRHGRGIYAYLRLEAASAAEDLLQETFARLLRVLPSYRPEGRFAAYLYRIARNLVMDWHRRGRRQLPWDQAGAERLRDPASPPDRLAADREEAHRLLRALPPEQREVVVLREFLELPFADIARLTGAPLGTVLARMHRALDRLRRIAAETPEVKAR
ncbi:MAG: sigma-70 family RNA polymerase sigma factor [Candidatus Eremiobacterota bacterium]